MWQVRLFHWVLAGRVGVPQLYSIVLNQWHIYIIDVVPQYIVSAPLSYFLWLAKCGTWIDFWLLADFQLHTDRQFEVGSSVLLTCDSGLDDSQDIQVNFTFTSNYTGSGKKVVTCDQNQTNATHSGTWSVYRSPLPPYDCVLQISSATRADAGEYLCIGLLPTDSAGQYWAVASNPVVVVESPTHSSSQDTKLAIITSTVAMTLVLVVITLTVICLVVYRVLYPPRVTDQERRPLIVSVV